jgi:hypothetical protein
MDGGGGTGPPGERRGGGGGGLGFTVCGGVEGPPNVEGRPAGWVMGRSVKPPLLGRGAGA